MWTLFSLASSESKCTAEHTLTLKAGTNYLSEDYMITDGDHYCIKSEVEDTVLIINSLQNAKVAASEYNKRSDKKPFKTTTIDNRPAIVFRHFVDLEIKPIKAETVAIFTFSFAHVPISRCQKLWVSNIPGSKFELDDATFNKGMCVAFGSYPQKFHYTSDIFADTQFSAYVANSENPVPFEKVGDFPEDNNPKGYFYLFPGKAEQEKAEHVIITAQNDDKHNPTNKFQGFIDYPALEQGLAWWIYMIIALAGLAVICLIVFIIIYIRKNKKHAGSYQIVSTESKVDAL